MKATAISKLTNGKFVIGIVHQPYSTIEFEQTDPVEYENIEEVEDVLYKRGKTNYVRAEMRRTIPDAFIKDICRIADEERALLEDVIERHNMKVTRYGHYEHETVLQVYGARVDTVGLDEVKANNESDYIRYICTNNYLEGISRGLYEVGVTLCYNKITKSHVCRGNVDWVVFDGNVIQ